MTGLTHSKQPERLVCGVDNCDLLLFDPDRAKRASEYLHRCALHEIASYNADELREWGEDNAADMVEIARKGLRRC